MPFAAKWMDLEITFSEVNQAENDNMSLICRIQNIIEMNVYTKQTDSDRKQTYGY